jgi:GntR family transcriptional regulator
LSGFSLVEFDQYIHLQNRIPSTQTILFETTSATQAVADKLNIQPDSQVIHIVQLRLADGLPIVYEERTFDYSLCPTMTQEELEKSSIHGLLVEKYKIPLIRLSHDIEITSLPEEQFDVFEVDEPVKVFAVNRLSYTQINDEICPAVWYQAFYRADEYQFQTQFHTSI